MAVSAQSFENGLINILDSIFQGILIHFVTTVVMGDSTALFGISGPELHEEAGAVFLQSRKVLSGHQRVDREYSLISENIADPFFTLPVPWR